MGCTVIIEQNNYCVIAQAGELRELCRPDCRGATGCDTNRRLLAAHTEK